jgi:hypothetical protein
MHPVVAARLMKDLHVEVTHEGMFIWGLRVVENADHRIEEVYVT